MQGTLAGFTSSFALSTLGFVLVLAGVAKLGSPEAFRRALAALGIRPALRRPAAIGVPVLELVIGTAAVLQLWPVVILLVIATLIAAFSLPVAGAALRGRSVQCGCFGTMGGSLTGWSVVGRNAGMVALAVAGALAGRAETAASSHVSIAAAISGACLVASWGVVASGRRLGALLRGSLDEVGGAP